MGNFSQSYMEILDLLFKTETIENNMHTVNWDNGQFKRIRIDNTTRRPPQAITITDDTLFFKCTPAQWYLVGLISAQLKLYNVLWLCPANIKKSSTNKIAIKGLIEMKVLRKTETPHIYIVNPIWIRKGDFHTALVTTAKMLMNVPKVLPEHIITKKPVAELAISIDHIPSQPNLGYGYADLGE